MKNYVTFDDTGVLTGGYCQELHQDHVLCSIEVDAEQRLNWTAYRANDTRDGIEPLPPVPLPMVVPARVTRRQARQALLLAGLLDQVPTLIAAIPDATQRALAQIEWEDSQEFERSRPLVISIGSALGLDAAGLDQLFIQAAGL